ncbi:MAG: hypothetical protein ABEJ72_02160, partial [Candidatus Aenigmatarchaeota archaeon]
MELYKTGFLIIALFLLSPMVLGVKFTAFSSGGIQDNGNDATINVEGKLEKDGPVDIPIKVEGNQINVLTIYGPSGEDFSADISFTNFRNRLPKKV